MLFNILFLIPVLCLHQAIGGCPSLEQIVSALPYLNSQKLVCVSDDTCSVLNCTSNERGNQSSLALNINSCDSIHLNANIPNIGINNWDTALMDQKEAIIPGFQLPDLSPPKQGYLFTRMEKSKNNSVSLSLELKGCNIHMDTSCPVIKRVLTNYQLPCNSQKKSCFLNLLNGCSDGETCSQLTPSSQEGICVCLPGHLRSPEGMCISSDPSNNTSPADIQPRTDDSNKRSGSPVVAEILVPVLLLALAAAVVVILHRHGLFGRLRNQLPSVGRRGARRFEEMSIGANEDDDDPPLP